MADFLHEETPLTISRRAFMNGICEAAATTGLRGRWQTIGESPRVICDTGHNAHGLKYVTEQLKGLKCNRLYCVIGFAKDKNIDEILPMFPADAYYIFTRADVERAVDADALATKATQYGLQGETAGSVGEALARARELATADDTIFVGGSTFVVAEAL